MDTEVNKTTSRKGYQRRTNSPRGLQKEYKNQALQKDFQEQKNLQDQKKSQDQKVLQQDSREQGGSKESIFNKSSRRDSFCRQSHVNKGSQAKYSSRVKAEETIEDIKEDINRIEKEIELEMKEIKSLRLGL